MISAVYQFEHPGRSKRKMATKTQRNCRTQVGACPSMSFFVSIYINNLVPSRSPTSTRSKPPFKIVLIVTLPIAEPVSRQHHSLSIRPFPFTLPNAPLPISSPQSCISNGDKHTVNSPIEITCQCHSSAPCYRSGHAPVMRERAYSNGRVSLWSISILTPCANAKHYG